MNRRRFLTTLAGSLAALAVPNVPLLREDERLRFPLAVGPSYTCIDGHHDLCGGMLWREHRCRCACHAWPDDTRVKVFDLGAMPKPCERVEDKDLGISIRFLRQWDHNRMDVLYGLAALRPDLAVRVIA
jgi:hypothetical protein